MRLLVSTQEPISARDLHHVTGGLPPDAEVLVVSPASTYSPLRFWVSDVDEAIAHADEVQSETVDRLGEQGIETTGEIGDSDPFVAIHDALTTFPADRIVVIEHAAGQRDYREDDPDVLAARLRAQFDDPVDIGTIARERD